MIVAFKLYLTQLTKRFLPTTFSVKFLPALSRGYNNSLDAVALLNIAAFTLLKNTEVRKARSTYEKLSKKSIFPAGRHLDSIKNFFILSLTSSFCSSCKIGNINSNEQNKPKITTLSEIDNNRSSGKKK